MVLGRIEFLEGCWTESLADCLEPVAINKHVGSLQHDGFLHQSQCVKKSAGKVEVTIRCINFGSHSAVVLPYSSG